MINKYMDFPTTKHAFLFFIISYGGSSGLKLKRESNEWPNIPRNGKRKWELPLPVSRTVNLVRMISCTDSEMPVTESSTQLQEFLGMVTYLSPFVNSFLFLHCTHPWATKEEGRIYLEPVLQYAFDAIKHLVFANITLQHFDVCIPVTIHIDAYKKELGTGLLQDGCPATFASKILMPAHQHYVSTEKKLLACIFGGELFHMSLATISLPRVTISLLRRLSSTIMQIPLLTSIRFYCVYRTMISPLSIS